MYESFDQFLQNAIKEYYERSGSKHRGRLVALLIASGEIAPMAAQAFKQAPAKNFAAGAAAAVALRVGLRFALSGPVAILVSGLTLASLLAYLVGHQRTVMALLRDFREAIDEVRSDYDRIQDKHAAGGYDDDERQLMIDGLTMRLLNDLDERAERAEQAEAEREEQAEAEREEQAEAEREDQAEAERSDDGGGEGETEVDSEGAGP